MKKLPPCPQNLRTGQWTIPPTANVFYEILDSQETRSDLLVFALVNRGEFARPSLHHCVKATPLLSFLTDVQALANRRYPVSGLASS